MRKNYFVKKKFQTDFFLKFVLLLLLEALFITWLFMHASSDTITTGYLNSTLRIENTSDFFFTSLVLIASIAGVGIGITGMVMFILFSHRMAGPLYRFEKILKEIEGGNLAARIELRKTDQMVEFRDAINAMAGSMETRIKGIRKLLNDAEELLSKPDAREDKPAIMARINAIKEELNSFKVSDQ